MPRKCSTSSLLYSNCCVVPLTSFSKFDHGAKQDVWLALGEDRPLAFFAGL